MTNLFPLASAEYSTCSRQQTTPDKHQQAMSPHVRHTGGAFVSYDQEAFDADKEKLAALGKEVREVRSKAFYIDDMRAEIYLLAGKVIHESGRRSHPQSRAPRHIRGLDNVVCEALINAERVSSAVKEHTSSLLNKIDKIEECLKSLCALGWHFVPGDMYKGLDDAELVLTEVWDKLEKIEKWQRKAARRNQCGRLS